MNEKFYRCFRNNFSDFLPWKIIVIGIFEPLQSLTFGSGVNKVLIVRDANEFNCRTILFNNLKLKG